MQQVDWKSADEIADDIINGEATYQLIVDLWSRVGELEKEVGQLRAKLRPISEPAAIGSLPGGPPQRWRTAR